VSHLVVALDPGGTTGLAYGHIDVGAVTIAITQEQMTLRDMDYLMRNILSDTDVQWHVIWETFEYRYRARPGLDQTPIKLIAIIELAQERGSGVQFYPQTAAKGKAFYTDIKLKQMGLYERGMPHARDAERHLLTWCTFGYGAALLFANLKTPEVQLIGMEEFVTRFLPE
jgi:hypothetical protein